MNYSVSMTVNSWLETVDRISIFCISLSLLYCINSVCIIIFLLYRSTLGAFLSEKVNLPLTTHTHIQHVSAHSWTYSDTHLFPLISWAGPYMKGITSTRRRTLTRWLMVNHWQTRSAQLCVWVCVLGGVLSAHIECQSFIEWAIFPLSWVNHCLILAATERTQQVPQRSFTRADSESTREESVIIFCLCNMYRFPCPCWL